MTATAALAMILVLSFAAERLAKAILFFLALVPAWRNRFPDPLSFQDRKDRVAARNRLEIVQNLLIAVIATAAVWRFEDIHILRTLTAPDVNPWIDMGVSVIVIMGGSEMLNRLLQVSGIGEGAAAPLPGRGRENEPIEISGRLVLESPDQPPPSFTSTA